MFTGIIETTGIITHIENKGTNVTFTIQSLISNDLKVDQSVAHNGICLTVEKIMNGTHSLTAIQETLQKTNAGSWKINDVVNIERCLLANSRIDGHFVQGHVDATATCILKKMKPEVGYTVLSLMNNLHHYLLKKAQFVLMALA